MADKETQGGAAPYIAEALRPLAIPIESVKPDPANARRHPDRNLDAIVASLSRFGQRSPIVVQRQGMVVRAGNGRLEAAKRLGWKHIAAVIVDESSTDATAFAIADNRTSDLAEWDDETLASLLQSLPDDAREAAGYDDKELSELLNTLSPEIVEDEAPEPLPDPVSKTGDVWVMGGHRLLCGDSTKAGDVERVTAGAKAGLCFTSPPYAQQREYTDASKEHTSDWDALMNGVFAVLPMAEDGQVLVNLGLVHRDGEWLPYWNNWIEWMRAQGWRRFGWYVWDQGHGLPGDWNGRLAPSHEFVFHFNKAAIRPTKSVAKNPLSKPMGSNLRGADGVCKAPSSVCDDPNKIADSVVRVNRNSAHGTGHPATFPVPLPQTFAESWPGDVYEPFSGSGTTIIACEQLGRKCYAIEIEPRYVDVAVRRWQKLTGKDAVLESSGKTWRETATERGVTINE